MRVSLLVENSAHVGHIHHNEFNGEQGNEIGIKLNAFSRYVDNDFLALKIYRISVEWNGCGAAESDCKWPLDIYVFAHAIAVRSADYKF